MSRFGGRLRGALPVSAWLRGGGGGVDFVQRGTITIAAGATSNTATLSIPVDVNRSRLVLVGTLAPAGDVAEATACRVALTNSTTVTASVNSTGAGDRTVAFEVIQYRAGVIRSIQRDTTTTATKAISAVTLARATIDHLGFTTNGNAAGTGQALSSVRLSSATEITMAVASGSVTVGYQVVDWY